VEIEHDDHHVSEHIVKYNEFKEKIDPVTTHPREGVDLP